MAQDYYAIVTTVGRIKLASAATNQTDLLLTEFAIGDGNGASPDPTAASVTLVNEVWRTAIESVIIDPDNPTAILVSAIIPTTAGDFYMREFGLFDADGDMIAVVKPVPQFKPTAAQGQLEDIRYEFQIIIGETANVNLLVEPSVLFATRDWVTQAAVLKPHKILTDDGIEGGGDLTQDRTFKMAVQSLSSITGANVDNASDWFLVRDGSTTSHKKIRPEEVAIAIGVQVKIDEALARTPLYFYGLM